ncbi:MAG TPA: hypothetical protein VL442_05360 [Mucilaginibacter sp.]|jgi:hypothetical protein|nr:hypothetical protein [Mucilaginibacter sp.]
MKSFFKKALYKLLTLAMDREKLMFMLSNKEEQTLLGMKRSGYLYETGWINSIKTGNVCDLSNNPIPWVTYPFINFIEERLAPTFELFEFGSGNSTLYYSKRVASVYSVENDKLWYEKIKNSMPENVNLFYCELEYDRDYCRYAAKTSRKFDIIIVDGRDRVNCCINSVEVLNSTGVLILDDSEREEYITVTTFLTDRGFKKIEFWGIAPTVNYLKCTSIFYRSDNCLGI